MKVRTSSFAVVKTFKLICASILMLGASVAFADPAYIISSGQCGMADGNRNFFSTSDVKQIVTSSANGNISLKCKAKGVPNDTGSEVRYDYYSTGAMCTALELGIQTEDWEQVVDAEGNATLQCKFRISG